MANTLTQERGTMPQDSKSGGELFIVDNTESDWKVLRYLKEWTQIAKSFDIATGHFEIGGMLALDGDWQNLEKIRVLMGDQVSIRTQKAFLEFLQRLQARLDESLEQEKQQNEFLRGVPAVVDALVRRQIECRVYDKAKFHAKAYITHAKLEVVGSAALVGSSNFSHPGLTENIELNIQVRAPGDVEQIQKWFEHYWTEAKEVTPELLQVIERHVKEWSPFEVYLKA